MEALPFFRKYIFLLLMLPGVSSAMIAQAPNNDKIRMAAETYGFLVGHFYAINQIRKQFPDASAEAAEVERQSAILFGKSKANIHHFLETNLAKPAFLGLVKHIDSLLENEFRTPIPDLSRAQDMLKVASSRLHGDMPDDRYASILAFACLDAPHAELSSGFAVKHTNAGRTDKCRCLHNNPPKKLARYAGFRRITCAIHELLRRGKRKRNHYGISPPRKKAVASRSAGSYPARF